MPLPATAAAPRFAYCFREAVSMVKGILRTPENSSSRRCGVSRDRRPALTRSALERIGNSFYDQGKLEVARDYYEQALHIDLDLRNTSDLASDYGNIANALDSLGDLAGSQKCRSKR